MAKRQWMLAAGAALVVVGLQSALLDWREQRRADASSSWPRASATILLSAVVQEERTRSNGRRRQPTRYHVDVARLQYVYSVAGRRYHGERYQIRGTPQGEAAHAVVSRHPPGSRTDVFYDPQQPGYALLRAGRAEQTFFVLPAIAFGVAAVLLLLGWFWPVPAIVPPPAAGPLGAPWRVPLRASFSGIRGVPLFAFATNNLAPRLELHPDHIVGRVLRRFERRYEELARVDVLTTLATRNVVFEWRDGLASFVANVRDDASRLRLLQELQRHRVPLSEKAQKLLAAADAAQPSA